MQGPNFFRARADFLAGRQLIEHVDQRFVGALRLMEKRFADRQAALFHRTIEVEQGFTELVHRLQVSQVRTFAEGGQFVQQCTELLALARMLLPTSQQAFGVQQDVHALGQEVVDQLRVTLDPQAAARRVREGFQALGEQRPGTLDQGPGTGDFSQRIALELAQPKTKQTFGLQQHFNFVQVECDQVGFIFPGQFVQRRRQLGNRQDPGYRRTALERVQGALQLIAGRQREVFGGLVEKTVEAIQMGLGFLAEDFQQQRVEGRDVQGVLVRCRGFALGQGMGTGRQPIDIVTLALGIGGVFGHQFRE
ncbi:hypothetical protein D3C76_525720 [compost metagenome]